MSEKVPKDSILLVDQLCGFSTLTRDEKTLFLLARSFFGDSSSMIFPWSSTKILSHWRMVEIRCCKGEKYQNVTKGEKKQRELQDSGLILNI